MSSKKPPELPRGLYRIAKSPFIFFSWRDSRGRQHMQSTRTTDPTDALVFKREFLELKQQEDPDEKLEDLGKLALGAAAEKYFEWKSANCSHKTIARERRMFKSVLKFFGKTKIVRSIHLQLIRRYQIERRKQISPTMKQPVGPRAVNYEMLLLKGVMSYARCWTAELEVAYQPLREPKSRAGKVATGEQLKNMIYTAMGHPEWQMAMWCGAVAAGSGCRGGEIRHLRLENISASEGVIHIEREIAKNRVARDCRLTALGEWGLHHLLDRAKALGATEPKHYLLPLSLKKSRHLAKKSAEKWDVTRPMTSWVKAWRKLMAACNMTGFRFHDLRHTFRTMGRDAGVPLETMMVWLGHMDRQTSLEYVHTQKETLDKAKGAIELQQQVAMATAQASPANGAE
jgi:integrase